MQFSSSGNGTKVLLVSYKLYRRRPDNFSSIGDTISPFFKESPYKLFNTLNKKCGLNWDFNNCNSLSFCACIICASYNCLSIVLRVIEKNAPSEKNKTTTNKTVSIIAVMPLFVRSSEPPIPVAQRRTMTTPDHATNF